MSFFFGGGGKTKPQYTGLQTQTSSSALPVPICWGQNRVAPNIIWQGDFKSHKHKQGKGGGKSMTTYTYSASFQLGICWGEIHSVVTIWKDQSKITVGSSGTGLGAVVSGLLSAKNGSGLSSAWTFFEGTTPQAPWGYLTSKHPTEALGYSGIAHADIANYDLGQLNTIGQHSFEVQALRWNTGVGGTVLDADPALIVEDFLTNDSFGVGFDMSIWENLYSTADATTTGDSTFQTYCRAIGFALSPCLVSQEAASDTLSRWAQLCNTAIVWTGYCLKMHPYGPDTITAHGVTYLPDFPVRYTLTDKDFIYDGSDPFKFDRVDPADAYNSLSMIIANRANDYNELPVPWRDQGLVDRYGLRKADNLDAKEITTVDMAQIVVSLIGQRTAYIRNTFHFTLPLKYCLLEPMDIVEVIDPKLGSFYILITDVEETDDDELEITAEEYPDAISRTSGNTAQQVTNTPKNTLAPPGPVNPPIIFEPPSSLAGSDPQVWVAVSGGDGINADSNWGGCNVYLSTDDVHYVLIGTTNSIPRMGKLSASLATFSGTNPDTAHTLSVNLAMSAGELDSEASSTDAAAGQNLCYVDGEYIAFEVPTLTSTYAYDLTNLWRGQYGSTIGAHASGTAFTYLDDAIFKYTLPKDYIGKTLYIKCQSLNLFDTAPQDLSEVTAYVFTPSGAAFGTGTGGAPSIPTGLSVSGGSVYAKLIWTANSANDNVTGIEVWRAAGAGASFGSATRIATTTAAATEYTDASVLPSTAYTYFLRALNVIGPSGASAGVSATTGAGASQPFGFAFMKPDPVASKPVAFFDTPVAWSVPSGLSDSQGNIGDSDNNTATAPSAQTDFDIQSPPGTSIGTMRFAASSLTATFIKASNTSIPLGQVIVIVAPSNLNGLKGTLYGSIKGTR